MVNFENVIELVQRPKFATFKAPSSQLGPFYCVCAIIITFRNPFKAKSFPYNNVV